MEYTPREGMEPNPNDVLCGRGGGTNNNTGNMNWREVVAFNKQLYTTLPAKEKMRLSRSIVSAVRSQEPPGRFLEKDTISDTWYDIGDERAQKKTSQALRDRLSNSTNQPAVDASSEPSQSSLVAPSSRPPRPMPMPGDGKNSWGFPAQIPMQMASKSNSAIDVNALPCPDMRMLPNDMTDYPEDPTHKGDFQVMPPMVLGENVIMVPTQAVYSPAMPPQSAPQGPVPEGTITLTERQLANLGADFSTRSAMSLMSFVQAWHPDEYDPLTAVTTTMTSPVQVGEYRGAGLKPAAQGNGSNEKFSNGLAAGADLAVGLEVPVPANGGLLEPGLFSDMISAMSIRTLAEVQNKSTSFENISGMSWQDSPSLGTIGTGLASLLLVTEDPRKLVNDCVDQEPMEAPERSRADFAATRNETCF
jgi:hypothetical protein